MKLMKLNLRFLLVSGIVLVGLVFSSNQVQAISNNCKNPALYETSFDIAPTSGLRDTVIQVTMKFRWNGLAYQACLDTNLNFDLSWGIVGSSWDGSVISEYSIGKADENWKTKVVQISVATLPGVSGGPANTGQGRIWFGMMVEDDDWTGVGDNLFNPIKKEYTISIGNRICAFVAPDGKYSCVTGSETVSNCSTLSQCNGQSCSRIDSSICGSLEKIWACVADDGKYACSNGNKSDLSDVSSCSGKTPVQVSVSRCGQTAGGGGGAGTCGGAGQPVCPPIPATETQTTTYTIDNPLAGGPNDLFDIIDIVTQWIIYISVPLAVLWIMYAGFLMLTAGPVPANFQKGRDILKYTVLGLAIIFIGKGFISLIISVIELGGTSPPPAQSLCVNGFCTNKPGVSCTADPTICNQP